MSITESNKKLIDELCVRYHVDSLYSFGSINTDRFSPSSDVDLLVQFINVDLNSYFDNYMSLKEKLEELFNRPVDLVENQAIRNPIFRKVVDRDKVKIYARKDT
jgi:predicted nucleotidyltransferase